MKDSVPERIERKMSHRDDVSFMKGTPVFARCRFSNVMQLPCHIGVKSAAQASLGFGRFRVLLRQRQLLADELPVGLGTRAFDLLLALLESDGSLVTKEQLLARVWPGITVAEDNVKVHVSALRKALGEDRDFIRTEFGRGYRFTAAVQLIKSGAKVVSHGRYVAFQMAEVHFSANVPADLPLVAELQPKPPPAPV